MSSGRPSETDIPKCTHCGGSRNFEFQVYIIFLSFLKTLWCFWIRSIQIWSYRTICPFIFDRIFGLCWWFQILPQLLYYFGVKNEVDSLDWATIVVYSCEASCEGNRAYKEEFVWVQLASQSSTVPWWYIAFFDKFHILVCFLPAWPWEFRKTLFVFPACNIDSSFWQVSQMKQVLLHFCYPDYILCAV